MSGYCWFYKCMCVCVCVCVCMCVCVYIYIKTSLTFLTNWGHFPPLSCAQGFQGRTRPWMERWSGTFAQQSRPFNFWSDFNVRRQELAFRLGFTLFSFFFLTSRIYSEILEININTHLHMENIWIDISPKKIGKHAEMYSSQFIVRKYRLNLQWDTTTHIPVCFYIQVETNVRWL